MRASISSSATRIVRAFIPTTLTTSTYRIPTRATLTKHRIQNDITLVIWFPKWNNHGDEFCTHLLFGASDIERHLQPPRPLKWMGRCETGTRKKGRRILSRALYFSMHSPLLVSRGFAAHGWQRQ